MRKIFLLVVIIVPIVILGILILKNKNTNPQKSSAEIITATPVSEMSNSTEVDNYTVSWFEVNDIEKLKLIPNFSEKFSSKDTITLNSCNFLSSGPFYSTDNQPLGLFISNNQTLSAWRDNSLFDGVLSTNETLTPRITRAVPTDTLINAIQTGPIIKENNFYQTLKIIDDTPSRRVIAAITGENKLYFLVVYDHNSQYSGPLLGNLPIVIKDFEAKSQITFADVINLDGGSASTFHTENTQLSEINPVGAFFCQP